MVDKAPDPSEAKASPLRALSQTAPELKLILASSSPRRKELLTQIGFAPDIIESPDVDETPHKKEKPDDFALRMGMEKAEVIAAKYDNAIIIAADTLVAIGTRIIGKAANRDEAFHDLSLMSGRSHRVYTGMTVIKKSKDKNQKSNRLVCTKVKFKRMTADEINWYLDQGEWEGKSGSFTLMGIGAGFIESISGSHTNVIGLPLCEARNILIGMGYNTNPLSC
jgi:septum formation protein